MSKNVDTTRRWFEEVWNGGRPELVDEIPAPNAARHVEDVFSSRGRVAARLTVTSTHSGSGLGIEPENRRVRIAGITIARFARGRVVEAWNSFDVPTLFDQLGALKRPVSAMPSL